MFRTISLPLFYLLLCSCSREVTMPVDSAASERPVTAELRITTEDMLRLATRATDEEAIRDINLYLFGRSNGQSLHFYSRSALVRFECLPGEYDLYVAANLGADLGERSAQQLLDYTIKWQEEYATLPMSAVMTVAIAPDKENNTVTLPPLSVRRTVAKIAYNIRVADKAPDLELYSVQLFSRYPCGQGFSQRPRLLRPRRRISPMLRSWSFPTLRGAAVRACNTSSRTRRARYLRLRTSGTKPPTTPLRALRT